MIDAQSGGSGGRERVPMERWTKSELMRLRSATDPEIDRVVASYHREHPALDESRDLVRSMIRELAQVKSDPVRFTRDVADQNGTWLTDALKIAFAPPAWNIDARLMARGQRVFADYGLYQASALFFASLPMAYATIDGAEVLARASDLATQNLTRRVAETGQMLLDVMGLRDEHSLDPGAPGYATAIGLRLLHACARVLILGQPAPHRWPTEKYGPPVNQELMLGTLLDFTIVAWHALERMGVVLSDAAREANIHIWSFIGLLMGVEACRDGPLSLADVQQISTQMAPLLGPSEAGQRLMEALLAEMEDFMPLGWRKLPRSIVWWLFRDAPGQVSQVPDMLLVPPAAWWSSPLLASLQDANRYSWLPGPLAPLARGLIRKLGRNVLIGYADRYSEGQPPFRVPDELARSWGIRTTQAGYRVRKLRRGIRRSVRAQARRRPGRTQSGGIP